MSSSDKNHGPNRSGDGEGRGGDAGPGTPDLGYYWGGAGE